MKSRYVVILTVVIFSCQNKSDIPGKDLKELQLANVELATDSTYTAAEQGEPEQTNKSDKKKQQTSQRDNPAEPVTDWTQKIIKTANLNVELKDYHHYNNTVHNSLAAYRAYIAQEQQEEDEAQITNVLSIKVPVDKFESLVNFLTADRKNKLLQKQITSADVTAEYADTKARLETKKQVRAKYHQFLGNASKIDDMLSLQSEINGITEDIEAATARVKSLGHQSAYSTINLKYFQVLDAKALNDNKPGFFLQLGNALKSGAVVLGDFLIAIITAWPLLLLIAGGWFFVKKYRLFNAKTQPVK